MTNRATLWRRVEEAMEQGDEVRLEASLNELVSQSPEDTLGRLLLGELLLGKAKWKEAYPHLEAARRARPKDTNVLALWSLAARSVGRVGEVVKVLRSAVDESASATLLILFADALQELGLTGQSLMALENAVRLEPRNEEACYNLAVAIKRIDAPRATKLLQAAIAEDPGYAEAFRELGYCLMADGHWSDAGAAVHRALELAPDDFWAAIYSAFLLMRAGNSAAAEQRIRSATSSEDLPIVHWLLGDISAARGDLDTARLEYERAVRMSPYDLRALQRLREVAPNAEAYWAEMLKAMLVDDELLRDTETTD